MIINFLTVYFMTFIFLFVILSLFYIRIYKSETCITLAITTSSRCITLHCSDTDGCKTWTATGHKKLQQFSSFLEYGHIHTDTSVSTITDTGYSKHEFAPIPMAAIHISMSYLWISLVRAVSVWVLANL